MKKVIVSDKLKTAINDIILHGYTEYCIYQVNIKFILDKELQFYIQSSFLTDLEDSLYKSRIFRLVYKDSGDIYINPNTIVAISLEKKEITNG